MQWVKQHIGAFGGDPNGVTLVGEGSGGACVSYHLLSKKSAGLFHRLVCDTLVNATHAVAMVVETQVRVVG